MNLLSIFIHLLPSSFRPEPESALHIQPVALGSFNMDHWLFPDSHNYTHAWTTSSSVDLPLIEHVELDNDVLNAHHVGIPPDLDLAPNTSTKAWRAFYPRGGVNPHSDTPSGFGLYLDGPSNGFKERLASATEVHFGYRVMFQEGWDWAKGGKLPGAYGGVEKSALRCTGGRSEARDQCFNLRLMWRAQGAGELYTYLPVTDENTSQLLKVPPKSFRNPDYGFSVGRGAFHFAPGEWTVVTERIKLNDVGSSNGEIEVRANGETVIFASGLVIRTSSDSFVRGLHCQTFFGGHGPEWASPKDQYAWFADMSGAIIA